MTAEQQKRLAFLDEMRRNGSIGEEEYNRERNRIFQENHSFQSVDTSYLALLHLSQLTGFFFAGLGFILPIILWAVKKDQDYEVNRHGRNILNFIISYFIYISVLAVVAIMFVIGIATIPFTFICVAIIIILIVLQIVFIIIAAVKASNNEYWEYPLSIPFFYVR